MTSNKGYPNLLFWSLGCSLFERVARVASRSRILIACHNHKDSNADDGTQTSDIGAVIRTRVFVEVVIVCECASPHLKHHLRLGRSEFCCICAHIHCSSQSLIITLCR